MPPLIEHAIPAFVLLMAVEAIADAIMRRELYEIKDSTASITMGLGNVAVSLLTKTMQLALFSWLYRFRVFSLGYRYNLSTALRQSWTGTFTGWIFWMWLPWLGFPPMMVLTMQAISLLYQFWIHTELVSSLGPLELVFNTRSHHRVHHGSNPRYIDRNHAGTLIVWDRLFGTFEPENRRDAPRFGLTKNIRTYNPVRIAFHEWADMWRDVRQAPGWPNKLRYVLGRPGWRHDGPARFASPSLAATNVTSP